MLITVLQVLLWAVPFFFAQFRFQLVEVPDMMLRKLNAPPLSGRGYKGSACPCAEAAGVPADPCGPQGKLDSLARRPLPPPKAM